MHQSVFAKKLLGVVCLAWLAGCSVLIDVDEKQCDRSADCVSAKLGDRCVDHVCVSDHASNETDAGADAGELPEGMCATDKQCGDEKAPRCMRGTCVTSELAERWMCETPQEQKSSGTVHYG